MLYLPNDTIDASITYIQHLDINPGTPATTNAGVKVSVYVNRNHVIHCDFPNWQIQKNYKY